MSDRGDRVEVAGIWLGLAGGTGLIVGEIGGWRTVSTIAALALLAGVLAVCIGTTLTSRSTGVGWWRTLRTATRNAFRFALDLL